MKFKITWNYTLKNKMTTIFHSDWIEKKDILAFANDIEKTGRVKSIEFLDETGLTWSKKELKKYLTKIEDEPDNIELYFDGSYRKETGEAGMGAVIYYLLGNDKVRHRWNQRIDKLDSNNEAEYIALHFALERLHDLNLKGKKIIIKGDSQGVLMQLKGEWPCYEENLNRWLDRIEQKMKRLMLYPEFEHINRNENKEADQLAKQAIGNVKIESKQVLTD